MDNKTEPTVHGKPWTNSFVCKSFQDADDKRNQILKENPTNLQVKVKRRSGGDFVVKTRSTVVAASKTKAAKTA